ARASPDGRDAGWPQTPEVTRYASYTPSALRTAASRWPRCFGSAISKLNRLTATRSRVVVTVADRMLTRSSDSTLVTSASSLCRSSASTWMATRNDDPLVGFQVTSTMRSDCTRRSPAFSQSSRCTLTPPVRVTKPKIASGGTGVQQRASLIQTSSTPLTTTPGSCAAPRARGGRVATAVSAMSSIAPSSPPYAATSRATTFCAETWLSPTAAYSDATSARCSSRAIVISVSAVSIRCNGRPCLRIALVIASLPASIASSRRSLLKYCRILVRARGLLTKPSQSWVGPAFSDLDVKISI